MRNFEVPTAETSRREGKKIEDIPADLLVLNMKAKSLIIPVGDSLFGDLPEHIKIEGNTFERKQEFHITAIGFAKGKEIKKALKEEPELEEELSQIISELDWSDINLLPEKYHIKQDKEITKQVSKKEKKRMRAEGKEPVDSVTEILHREAIIQMVEVPAINDLYQRFKEAGVDLGEIPPAHVTLYTNGDVGGIGINSEAELQALQPEPFEIDY